jgi:hypothetical protein
MSSTRVREGGRARHPDVLDDVQSGHLDAPRNPWRSGQVRGVRVASDASPSLFIRVTDLVVWCDDVRIVAGPTAVVSAPLRTREMTARGHHAPLRRRITAGAR